jgi:hypothetical protein
VTLRRADEAMSMATRTDTLSPALHAADRHDLISVHGARVNNLKDVSVEIPKPRRPSDFLCERVLGSNSYSSLCE